MRKKFLLISAAVIAVTGLVLAAAGTGESDSGRIFRSSKAAAAAVGDNDLQIEVLHTRFCRNPHRHGESCVQEIVGRVVSTGKNVTGFRPGECVGFSGRVTPCGECADCRADRPDQCRYAGRVCETGCERHPDGCRNRVVISCRHVIALSGREAANSFAHLCKETGTCPQLFCHDSVDGGRNRAHGHGRCSSGHSHHCR